MFHGACSGGTSPLLSSTEQSVRWRGNSPLFFHSLIVQDDFPEKMDTRHCKASLINAVAKSIGMKATNLTGVDPIKVCNRHGVDPNEAGGILACFGLDVFLYALTNLQC